MNKALMIMPIITICLSLIITSISFGYSLGIKNKYEYDMKLYKSVLRMHFFAIITMFITLTVLVIRLGL